MEFIQKVQNLFASVHSPDQRPTKEERAVRNQIKERYRSEGRTEATIAMILGLLQIYAQNNTPAVMDQVLARAEQHEHGEISNGELLATVGALINEEEIRLFDEQNSLPAACRQAYPR